MGNWSNVKCCICGKPLWNGHVIEPSDEIKDKYFGNNPQPISADEADRCCDECNNKLVVPDRIKLMFQED